MQNENKGWFSNQISYLTGIVTISESINKCALGFQNYWNVSK